MTGINRNPNWTLLIVKRWRISKRGKFTIVKDMDGHIMSLEKEQGLLSTRSCRLKNSYCEIEVSD